MIIGLTGLAGSGKDTAAERLIGNHGFFRFGFADHLKEVMATMFSPLGIEREVFFDRDLKEQVIPALGVSPRHIMQSFGTEWARQQVNQDIWLMVARAKLAEAVRRVRIVVSDVRFDNEANLIRELKGTVIHVRGRKTSAVGSAQGHASEAGVAQHEEDLVLDNSRDIPWLNGQVDALLRPCAA